jgi:hypothetical protein
MLKFAYWTSARALSRATHQQSLPVANSPHANNEQDCVEAVSGEAGC